MATSRQLAVLGCLIGRLSCKDAVKGGLVCADRVSQQQKRWGSQKHYNPLYRKHRARKVADRPWIVRQMLKDQESITEDERRHIRRKLGLPPINVFAEVPINLTATNGLFDEYAPPAGDGKSSLLNVGLLKDTGSAANSKRKSLMATRKMKQYDPTFKQADFLHEAEDIYFEAQELLKDFKANEDRLLEIATLYALEAMTTGLEMKTVRWKFIETVEPPKVVQVRCEQALTEENYFAQITVRFFTKQTLAVYDRFGRLMYGSEDLPKDCLEYIVFEKHVVDEYGKWRLHGKIIPDWAPPRAPIVKSYRKPEVQPVQAEEEKTTGLSEKSPPQDPPQLASA